MATPPRQSWLAAEPNALARERESMDLWAPEMIWDEGGGSGAWEGLAPVWPFDRPEPACLHELLAGRRLKLRVEYRESFPMVEPRLVPLDPVPPREHRTRAEWHVNGDGTLCLLQDADMWTGRETAGDLVVKAAGWFIEYLLLEAGHIEKMTVTGINSDTQLDEVIEAVGCSRT